MLLTVSNVDGKFLLAARKFRRPTCTEFIITLNSVDIAKEGSAYVGKLRYFIQSMFTVLLSHSSYVLTHSFPMTGQTFSAQSSQSMMHNLRNLEQEFLRADPLG